MLFKENKCQIKKNTPWERTKREGPLTSPSKEQKKEALDNKVKPIFSCCLVLGYYLQLLLFKFYLSTSSKMRKMGPVLWESPKK